MTFKNAHAGDQLPRHPRIHKWQMAQAYQSGTSSQDASYRRRLSYKRANNVRKAQDFAESGITDCSNLSGRLGHELLRSYPQLLQKLDKKYHERKAELLNLEAEFRKASRFHAFCSQFTDI